MFLLWCYYVETALQLQIVGSKCVLHGVHLTTRGLLWDQCYGFSSVLIALFANIP